MIVASFWTGTPLSFFEQVCLKSFADRGHRTILYSYMVDLNVPSGVELGDARDILPEPSDIKMFGGFAQFSDIFRLNMIKKTGAIWVDCDVACVGELPNTPHIFARSDLMIGNAVLGLPQNSAALDYLVNLFNAKELVFPPDFLRKHMFPEEILNQVGAENGLRVTGEQRRQLPYMTFGPVALTYALRMTREIKRKLPETALYPAHRIALRRNFFRPQNCKIELPPEAVTIHHIGGKPFRVLFERSGESAFPHPESFIGLLCEKHEIVPEDAPMLISPAHINPSDGPQID